MRNGRYATGDGQMSAVWCRERTARKCNTARVGIYKHAVMSRSSKRTTGLLYVDIEDGIPRILIDTARAEHFNVCVMPVDERDREMRRKQVMVQGRAVLITDKPPASWAHVHRAGFGVIRVRPSSSGGAEHADDSVADCTTADAPGIDTATATATDTVATGGMRVRRVDSCASITPKLLTDTAVEGLAVFLAFVAVPNDPWFRRLR